LEKSSPEAAGRTPFESEPRDVQTECANASSVQRFCWTGLS
jgi:hypothetical protein